MKKQVKIISAILIVMMIVLSISNVVLAAPDISGMITDVGNGNDTDTTKISSFGKTIVTVLTAAGVIAAIVVLLVLGIKYMMGSAEEKAEYKKTMIPYLIGAALLFGASAIVQVIYNVINSGAGQAVV